MGAVPDAAAQPVEAVRVGLERLRRDGIWPEGPRYLWTDAFGVVLLVSLHEATGDARPLEEACRVAAEVERVLGRPRGLRIGEAPDRDGQYFHYLAMWLFALGCLGRHLPRYRRRAVELAHAIHGPFVLPGVGVYWKMLEDLSGPYPGYGLGALDPYDGYVSYRLLEDPSLEPEIAQMRELIEAGYRRLVVTQDLGVGMMLWLAHWFPDEPWAELQRRRCLAMADQLWVESGGCFCREPGLRRVRFAFTNHGMSLGLQAAGAMPERVARVRETFRTWRSGDEYDTAAITHVMSLCADYPAGFLRRDG